MKKILLILAVLTNFNSTFSVWNCAVTQSYAERFAQSNQVDNYFKNNNVPVFELWNKSKRPIYYSVDNGQLNININKADFQILNAGERVVGYSPNAKQPKKPNINAKVLDKRIDISKPTYIKLFDRPENSKNIVVYDTSDDKNKTIYLSWSGDYPNYPILYPQTGPCVGSRGVTESLLYTGFKNSKTYPKTNILNLKHISEDFLSKFNTKIKDETEKQNEQLILNFLKPYDKLKDYNIKDILVNDFGSIVVKFGYMARLGSFISESYYDFAKKFDKTKDLKTKLDKCKEINHTFKQFKELIQRLNKDKFYDPNETLIRFQKEINRDCDTLSSTPSVPATPIHRSSV